MEFEKYITGAVAIFLSLAKLGSWYLKRRRVKLNEKRLKTFLEDSKHCDVLAESITLGGYADRVMTFRSHDSGGLPKLGIPYYTSVVSAFYRDKTKDKSKRYENIYVDDHYKDIILNLLKKSKLELETEELHNGMLKDIYKDEGVVYTHIYKLAITDRFFFYMSVSWFQYPTDAEILEADLVVNQIQTIYRQHHKNN